MLTIVMLVVFFFHNGTGTQWDGGTMGRGHNGTGAQRGPPVYTSRMCNCQIRRLVVLVVKASAYLGSIPAFNVDLFPGCLHTRHSSGCPVRRLALQCQRWEWLAPYLSKQWDSLICNFYLSAVNNNNNVREGGGLCDVPISTLLWEFMQCSV